MSSSTGSLGRQATVLAGAAALAGPEAQRVARERLAARFETVLIVAGLLANMLLLPREPRLDGVVRFNGLDYLMHTGSLPSIKYSMLQPIFASPLYLLGDVYKDAYWWCERFNVFVLGAGVLAMYLLLRDRVDRGLLRRFFLLLVVASMFTNHLLFFYGEVFTAVLVAVGCVAVVVGPRLQGWGAVVLGVVNTPASLAALAPLTLTHVARTRLLRYLAVPFAALALIMLFNWAQRGAPLDLGYGDDRGARTVMPYSGQGGLSNPIFFGVLSLLFSSGKGLLFFAPGLFLPVGRALAATPKLLAIHRMWVSFTIGLLLFYGMYWSWHAGWFWGPRYLLFAAIPAAFAIAVRVRHREDASLTANIFTTLALALSIWVGINGAVFGDAALVGPCLSNPAYEVPLCYHTPEFSVLWYPFVHATTLTTQQLAYLVFALAAGAYLLLPQLTTTGRQLIAAARVAGLHTRNLRF